MVSPTKSGVIVERRDQVLIGRLSDVARAASTFDCKWWSTNGPFLIERAILFPLPLLCRVAAADDHAVGTLVATCLITLGRRPPGGYRMTAAIGRQHLDAMYGCAHRNVAQWQAIAGLDRRLGPAHQLRAGRDAARSDDVAPLAIAVEQQGEMCAAVRVVFEPFHLGRDTILVAAKIDDAVMLLVAAALVAHGDVAIVVAPRTAFLRLDQRLDGPALVQVRIDDLDQRATAGRARYVFDTCHDQASCAKLISW